MANLTNLGGIDRALWPNGVAFSRDTPAFGYWPRAFPLTPQRAPIIFNGMVEYEETQLDATFAALANPTRRSLLDRLAQGEATVGELAEPYQMSLAGISKHLRVLEEAGLVQRRVVGRVHHLSLDGAPIGDAAVWLLRYRRFWQESLDALAAYLEEEAPS